MLIINVESVFGFIITIFKYLPKKYLVYIILVIYLKANLLKKINLNLGYILIKAFNFYN